MENAHAMYEFYWLQKQQQVEENRKCIENTQLNGEHETNQLEKERICNEESEETSEGLTIIRAAKKQVKKDEAKIEGDLLEEIRSYPCLWKTSCSSSKEQQKKQFAWSLIEQNREKKGNLHIFT